MISNENAQKQQESHGNNIVLIYYKDIGYKIHRGSQTVTEIKVVLGIEPDYLLFQIVDGAISPTLEQNAKVTIKGGEIFGSQPPDGSSS